MPKHAIIEKVYKSSFKLLIPANLDETYDIVVKEAMRLVKADYGTIHLIEENGELRRVYATDPLFFTFMPRRGGYTDNAIRMNKPVIPPFEATSRAHPAIKKLQAKSNMVIPLSYEGKSIGVLVLLSKKTDHFAENDLDIVKFFGPLASLAIMKTRYYEETKKALESRDLFISMASHELKTPLTTLNIFIKIMQKKIEKGEHVEEKWMNSIIREVLRLTKLANELLQLETIREGKLHYFLKETSIRELIQQTIASFLITHPLRKVIFKNKLQNGQEYIKIDTDKFTQVLTNLMTNAVKFSDKNAPITIELSHKNGKVALSVSDKGKGIPAKDVPHIFDKFYRGSNHQNEGMGLGLYLTKEIINEHNGSIKVTSTVGKGTKFLIELPSH